MKRFFISGVRYRFVGVVVLIGFLSVVARLSFLHIMNQDKLASIAEQNRKKFDVVHARRGSILDVKGNILATTRPLIELGVDPQMLEEADKAKWPELAKLIGMQLKELEKLLSKKAWEKGDGSMLRLVRWRKLAESVDEDLYSRVLALKIKGVYGNRKFEREYPGGELAAHVLGFVNKEGQAAMGVESCMDFYLRGQNGWVETERDGRRRELAQFRTREVESHDGYNVVLSLDSVIQHVLEEEVARVVKELSPKAVSIIVSEPTTGYILGLANYPSFDPNRFWEAPIDSHRNRVVSDVFEPGSVFKSVTASAGFEEGVITLEDEVDCSLNKVEYKGRIVKLPKDWKRYNVLSIRDVIRKSSNRGAAYIGMLLGEQRMYRYAKAFGFGEKSGYELGAEVSGILNEVKYWDGLTISRFPMGHAIGATALQVNYAMGAIANNGVLMRPKVILRATDDAGKTIADFQPEPRRRVISTQTAKKMCALLGEVVGPNGTSNKAAVKGLRIAGKSGTSQKIIEGKYSNSQHTSTFSGFFPYDQPKVVLTVVIDDAKMVGTAYGGLICAPAFKNIAEKVGQYLNIKPVEEVEQKTVANVGRN